jgi:hypothetical protein
MVEWSAKIGPETAQLVARILSDRHPERGFRSCLGIFPLAKDYPSARVEAAARRAMANRACSYKSLKTILENNLDGQAIEPRKKTLRPSIIPISAGLITTIPMTHLLKMRNEQERG